MMTKRTSRLLPLALIALSCAAPLAAQLTDAAARQQAAEARELQEAGSYTRAVELTQRGLNNCGTDDCRHRLYYTLGYLHQVQSRKENPEEARVLLRKSAEKYGDVLRQLPAHWPTLRNLLDVYEILGEPQQAESALRRGLERRIVSAEKKATLALALGDLYLRAGRGPESVEAYQMAIDAMPEHATPKRRNIEAYDELSAEQLAAQIEELKDWEEQHSDIAEKGYKVIVRRLWNQNPQVAETALLRWLHAQGRWGTLGRESLLDLPRDWAPILDLEKFMVEPSARLSPWWFEKPLRSDALASFILAVGRGQEGPKEVLRTWEPALDLDPPQPLTAAWFVLYTEMVELLHRQGLTRQRRDLFAVLEERLLGALSDGGEIAEPVRERLHRVLGQTYAKIDSCDSTAPERSAVFHLERAIEYAEPGREVPIEPYQPAGHLHAHLAKCYQSTGKPEAAFEAHLEAYQSFIDADQLQLAAGQLAAATALIDAGYAQESERFDGLRMVQFLRQYAAERQDLDLRDGICSPGGIDLTLSTGNLPPDFLTRQRFKIRSDCIRHENVSNPVLAAAEVFELMLDKQVALVGPQDLVRFEIINQVVLGLERLELEIIDTDQPVDSALYLRLAIHQPSPARRYTYVKANPVAVGRIGSILENPPGPQEQTEARVLRFGTRLRVELLATIFPERVMLPQTFPGRLVFDLALQGGGVLPKGSEVQIQAERPCEPLVISDDRHSEYEECEWRLSLRTIKVDNEVVPIDADRLPSLGTGARPIPAGTTLVFMLRRPLVLD